MTNAEIANEILSKQWWSEVNGETTNMGTLIDLITEALDLKDARIKRLEMELLEFYGPAKSLAQDEGDV